jgi:hypothetical protein
VYSWRREELTTIGCQTKFYSYIRGECLLPKAAPTIVIMTVACTEMLSRTYLNTIGSEAAPAVQIQPINMRYLIGILTGSSNDLSLLLLAFSLDERPEVLPH